MEDLIIYLDEDGKKQSLYCNIKMIDNSIIEFETSKNTIILPLTRILKIKRRGTEDGRE